MTTTSSEERDAHETEIATRGAAYLAAHRAFWVNIGGRVDDLHAAKTVAEDALRAAYVAAPPPHAPAVPDHAANLQAIALLVATLPIATGDASLSIVTLSARARAVDLLVAMGAERTAHLDDDDGERVIMATLRLSGLRVTAQHTEAVPAAPVVERDEAADLRAALEMYGQHALACSSRIGALRFHGPCNCGLAALLAVPA